jgi:hypothetical protein
MSENDTTKTEPVQAGTEPSPEHDAEAPEKTSFIDLPSRWDRWEPLAEIIATLLLALATLATAWSGYQSARWGGEQASNTSQSIALRTESTRASTLAGQRTQIDIGLFTNWINAYAHEDQRLADFYENRFPPELAVAFDAWIATDPINNPGAPKSPFSMEEYDPVLLEEAQSLEAEAEEKSQLAAAANQIADEYILNTVILASVLFLTGVQSRMKSVPARSLIILLSLVILSYGLYNIARLPFA